MKNLIDHAEIPEPLWQVLRIQANRRVLMDTIVDTYFPIKDRNSSSLYNDLREEIDMTRMLKESLMPNFQLDWTTIKIEAQRDRGFRDAILVLYDYSCAICRFRLKSPTGNTVVDASHIARHNIFHNDDPRNGIALCKTHHWLFDHGLVSLDKNYTVLVSNFLHENHPKEWLITQYKGMRIRLPKDNQFDPHPDAMKWHRKNVFWGK